MHKQVLTLLGKLGLSSEDLDGADRRLVAACEALGLSHVPPIAVAIVAATMLIPSDEKPKKKGRK